MGFSTAFSTLASTAVSNAILLLGDITPVLGVMFAVTVFGGVVAVLRRFMP